MARGKELPLNLPSLDDLFTTQEERDDKAREKIVDVPISEIDGFPDHPFRVRDDQDMLDMVESVREFGVLTPAVLRRKDDGRYELVSGHRRKRAAEIAGLDTLPSIVRDMSRDEAVIAMVDANLQRERILPSEKAYSYKMKLEAMRRRAGRPRLENGAPSAHHFRGIKSRDILAEQVGESKDQIRRYIRLTKLIPEILDLVDEGNVGMRPAVEISYLPKTEQVELFRAIERQSCTPSHAQAIKLRKFSSDGRLSPDVIRSIMCEEKPNQAAQFRMPDEAISRFFKPGTSREEKAARIVKALELLERQERKRSLER